MSKRTVLRLYGFGLLTRGNNDSDCLLMRDRNLYKSTEDCKKEVGRPPSDIETPRSTFDHIRIRYGSAQISTAAYIVRHVFISIYCDRRTLTTRCTPRLRQQWS